MKFRNLGCAALVTAAATLGAIPATSASAAGPTGTLNIVVAGNGGLNYDPQLNALPSATQFMDPVFDTLINESLKGALSPGLASSWAFSNKGLTLTLNLRPNVMFQDNSAMNAAAVAANINREQTNPDSVVSDELTQIKSVSTPNTTTVVIHLKSPEGALLGFFAGPAGMMESPASWTNKNEETNPVGAGPYEISSTSVPGSDMVYTAFPGYWDPSVQKVATVNIIVSAEASFVPSMTSNSANAVILTGAATDGATLKSDGGFNVKQANVTFLHLLYLNKTGIFKNEDLRAAVSYAINRASMCSSLLPGACSPAGQPVASNSWAFDSSLKAPGFSDKESKKLLKEGGKAHGFSFVATVAAPYGEGVTELTAIQSMLAKVGIKMRIDALPIPDLLSSLDTNKVQAYYGPDTGGSDPAIPISVDLGSAYNPGGFKVPALTSMLNAANAATSSAARVADYKKASAEYQTSFFNVGVLNQNLLFATATNVSGAYCHDPLVLEVRGVSVS
jgi:peptide/nickel transport system substrate-binding protein